MPAEIKLTLLAERDMFIATSPDKDLSQIRHMLGWSKVRTLDNTYAFENKWGNFVQLGSLAREQQITLAPSDEATAKAIDALRDTYKNVLKARRIRDMDPDDLEDMWDESGIETLLRADSFMPYQKRGTLWALQVRRGGLYFSTGLGKSLIGLAVMSKLHADGLAKKFLIVAPKTLLGSTAWPAEIRRFTEFDVCDLSKTRRAHDGLAHSDEPRIHLVNPELITARCFTATDKARHSYVPDNLITQHRFDYLFFDESAILGNPGSLITKAMTRIARDIPYVTLASGVPSPNNCLQLFAQGKILGGVFGDSFETFQSNNCFQKQFGSARVWRPRPGTMEKMRQIIDPCAFFLDYEGNLELPPRRHIDVLIDMDEEQRKLYKELERDYIATVRGVDPKTNEPIETQVAIKQETVLRIKLMQVLGGFVMAKDASDETETYALPANPKLDRLLTLLAEINERGESAIVWAHFRFEIETIYRAVCDAFGPHHAAYVYGNMSEAQREEQMGKWKNDDKCRVMVANGKSVAYGHTWVKANNTVYFSATSDYNIYTQSRARNYRYGQTKPVNEYKIKAKGSIENAIWDAITNRTRIDRYMKNYLQESGKNSLLA